MPSETIGKTFGVAAGVCVVCSLCVSSAAVFLKPLQDANRTLDKRKNILIAAGLMEEGEKADVGALFREIDTQVVDLSTGQFVTDVSPEDLEQGKAGGDSQQTIPLSEGQDIAGIKKKPKYRAVYLLQEGGRIERVILPVRGMGLWSMMRGFVALDANLNTIESFLIYEHGETPGLGGEVDNPRWKKQWVGKKAFDENGRPALQVVKPNRADSVYEVDGLSGATITSRGVENLVRFWLGEQGYGPLLETLRKQKTDGQSKTDAV